MDLNIFYVTLIFIVYSHQTRSKTTSPDLPSFLKLCKRNDPRLNDCMKRSVEAIRPYLKTGIPSLQIPPCEPLDVPQIELIQSSGPVSMRAVYKNIKVTGGTDFSLRSLKIDKEHNRVRLKLFIPRLETRSEYNIDGKVLLLPIRGHGAARGNYTDVDALVTIQGERYQDPGTRKFHFRVTNFQVDFEVGHAEIHLDNLFNGDDTLSEAMNAFLNENWKTVAQEIKPALAQTIAKLFKSFSNKIYAKYPLDVILPP